MTIKAMQVSSDDVKTPRTLGSRFKQAFIQYGLFLAVGLITAAASMWRYSRPANQGLFKNAAIEVSYIILLVPALAVVWRVLRLLFSSAKKAAKAGSAMSAMLRSLHHLSVLMVGSGRGD